MVLLKKCIAEGCTVDPHFGWKPADAQELVWACKEHQRLIWRPAVKAAVAELVADLKQEQGRLL